MTEIQIETMDETEAYLTEGEPTDEQLLELNEATEPEDNVDTEEQELTEDDAEAADENDELVLANIVPDILEAGKFPVELTMYQVAKVLNHVLEIFQVTKDGRAYQVRPQMVYNYNRNKMVVRVDGKGTTVDKATREQATEFIVRFVSKLI